MRLNEASADYARLLQLDPANPQNTNLYLTLGSIHLVQKKYTEAVYELTRPSTGGRNPHRTSSPRNRRSCC